MFIYFVIALKDLLGLSKNREKAVSSGTDFIKSGLLSLMKAGMEAVPGGPKERYDGIRAMPRKSEG